MKALSTILILIGFCMGTLGAAGFHSPWESASTFKLALEGKIPGFATDASDEEYARLFAEQQLRALYESTRKDPKAEEADLLAFFGWESVERAKAAPELPEGEPLPAEWLTEALASQVPGHPMAQSAEAKREAVVMKQLTALQARLKEADPEDEQAQAQLQAMQSPLEAGAPWYFGGGLALLVAGGVLARRGRQTTGADESQEGRKALHGHIQTVHAELDRIHQLSATADPLAVRDQLTALQEGPLYDLTSEFEHWTRILGFDDYARIWAHVASGERLSNRAWTLYTDGFPAEGRVEIGLSQNAFAEAERECATESSAN